jgi:hypothetical protein
MFAENQTLGAGSGKRVSGWRDCWRTELLDLIDKYSAEDAADAVPDAWRRAHPMSGNSLTESSLSLSVDGEEVLVMGIMRWAVVTPLRYRAQGT